MSLFSVHSRNSIGPVVHESAGRIEAMLVNHHARIGDGERTINDLDTRAAAIVDEYPFTIVAVQKAVSEPGLDTSPVNPFALQAAHQALDRILEDI